MDEKKMSGVTPQETVEELNDAELSQVSGGGMNVVAVNPQRNLSNLAPNTANVSNAQGQQKYKINRLNNSISVTPSKQPKNP